MGIVSKGIKGIVSNWIMIGQFIPKTQKIFIGTHTKDYKPANTAVFELNGKNYKLKFGTL